MHPSTIIYPVEPGQECINPFVDGFPRKLALPVVYVADMIGTPYCKIGSTSNIRTRFGQFQTSSPFVIECAFYLCPPVGWSHVEIEKAAHDLLDQHKVRSEWFSVDREWAIDTIRETL